MTDVVVVKDPSGDRQAFGPREAAWLMTAGHVHGEPPEMQTLRSVQNLMDLVQAEPTLRECELCRATPTTHCVNVRRFVAESGPRPGPRGPGNPVFVCEACADLIERNRKRDLIDHAVKGCVAVALALTPELAKIADYILDEQLRQPIRQSVRRLVADLFAARNGRPVRLDANME